MQILEELWYGNINPNEQGGYWTKECLEKIHECWLVMQQYAECSAFITGFRLAVQLMAASF